MSNPSETKKTIILGDTHGSTPEAMFTPNANILHVGDFGIGFAELKQYKFNLIDAALKENNSHLYVNRGNHDSPTYWKTKGKYANNITFVDSYETLSFNGETFLFLGGATSIDRKDRRLGTSYWTEEAFDFDLDKLKAVPNIKEVTAVVSHTAPAFAPPVELSSIVHHYATKDLHLYADLNKERQEVSRLFMELVELAPNLHSWYYGHFHPRTITNVKIREVNFCCLPINDAIELKPK